MRFRKRLSAAILAIVMIVSSVQAPYGVAYAAEETDAITAANTSQEHKEISEGVSESADGRNDVSDGEERQEDSAESAEGENRPDEGVAADDDNPTEKATEETTAGEPVADGTTVGEPVTDSVTEEEPTTQQSTTEETTTEETTTEEETLGEIQADLQQYQITYELDGGTNDSGNPSTYTSETETIVLKDAFKNGCTFDGWYRDAAFQEKVTQIDKGSTGDITLYAKWNVNKYDFENLDQTYMALDGTTLHSTADKKPKVLIFYNNDESVPAPNTIKSIRNNIRDFSGVDIYAIECSGDTKDRVNAFKVMYGCNEIRFAYDIAEDANNAKMSEYAAKAGIPEDTWVDAPIISYIDAGNKFQLLTKGESSAADVLANLEEYCGYAFKINYVLNGGTNDSNNPDTYTSRTETIVLKDASKNGCVFEGWYQDAEFQEKVTQIDKGSKGDITLYAKWDVEKYNLTNPQQSYTAVDNKTMSSKVSDGKPKVLIFYFNDNAESQRTIESIRDQIGAFCGANIFAIECSTATKENVSAFQKQYGCDELRFAYSTTKDTNINKMSAYTAAIGIPEGSDVNLPVICYIDTGNRFQLLTQGESSADDILSNLEEYCGYTFKITYELDGGTNDSSNPAVYTSKTDTIVLKSPTKEGCTFKGWYKDANYLEKVTEIVRGSIGDITLYAKWRVNEYNHENPDQTYTALDGTKLTSKAAGKPKVLIFYVNDDIYDRCKNTIKSIRDGIRELGGADIYAIECGKTDKDSVSAFRNSYGCSNIRFAYDSAGTVNEPGMKAYELAATGKNQQTHTYPYICYIDTDNRFQLMTVGESSAEDILTNLKEYCSYVIPENVYEIIYELDGGTNNSGNPGIYTSGTAVTLLDPAKEGYVFEGWYKDAKYSEKVTEIAKESTGNITLYAKWRVKGYNLPNLEQTYKALDGTELSSKADGRPKVLIFYIYNSGRAACKNTMKSVSDNIVDFGGVDIYAIECNKGMKDNVSTFRDTYGSDKIPFAYDTLGNVNKPGMRAYEKAARGKNETTYTYPLICYIDANNLFQLMTVGESSAQDMMSNLQDYCGYVYQEETYKITYELNGGVNDSSNPATYTAKTETIVLKAPVKEGCTFDGWYKDAKFSEKVTEIPKGSTGDIMLYAKWRVKGYDVANLDQTYMATDGKMLSSRAAGKPKVLIFYFNNNTHSRNTIKSISGSIGDFYGVDIYAVECNKGTKDSVSQFQQKYGCDRIAFSYDEAGATNHPGMSAYAAAIGMPEGTTVTLPIICYIDADNKFQLMTQDESSAEDVLNNLRDYCGYVPEEGDYRVAVLGAPFVYNGKTQKPKVEVMALTAGGKYVTLKEGTDYKLSYKNNKNAGDAKVIITGIGEYTGTMEAAFVIEPAPLVIRAADMVILVGDKIPAEYEYEVDGLIGTDSLLQPPVLNCDIASTALEGEYTVMPSGADAGGNYTITYEAGILIVAKEYVYWQVTFDTQGHGKAPAPCKGIRSGDTIECPEDPKADGYRFDGWYKDAKCTKAWDFDMDIVETDLTLYAKWLYISNESSFALQEVPDQHYTGKALKPAVSVYDGSTLLKAGKDYQLKYYNNINVNADGVWKKGSGQGADFNGNLPYVEIIGKGNYKNTVKVNFNIRKASIGDGSMAPAPGVVLKVNDYLTKSSKALKPTVSLKFGRALKKDQDFTIRIEPTDAYDSNGYQIISLGKPEIPAGATGEFTLVVRGTGNYEGSVTKQIYAADSNHLLKNAKITLGENQQTVKYTGKPITLKGSKKEGKNVFTVQIGKKILDPATDYYVVPTDGSAGSAELVIVGKGDYVGRQTAPFIVAGFPFTASTVSIRGIQDRVYDGKAWTQNNDAVVTYKGMTQPMVYGADYTITYSRNINKGTATMTFIGNPAEGYTGKVKKTFKIVAGDIADTSQVVRDSSMGAIRVSYVKAGAKPVDEIILTNQNGIRLRYGKDYTLKYKNNKAVTKSATVTVTGKGNYSGKFDVSFEIVKVDLSEDRVVVQPAAVAYNANKADDFVYKPAVRIKDGKASLSAGKDYNIEYLKNTQADYRNYLAKLAAGTATDEDMPRVRITAIEGSNYSLRSDLEAIEVQLQIYQTKLNKRDLSVYLVGEAVYTGGQVTPEITVSYGGKTLREGVDYMLIYGANNKSGKNKGSVTISGLAPYYGGSVTCKFDIVGKDLKY